MTDHTPELMLAAAAAKQDITALYGVLSKNTGGPTEGAERWFNDHINRKVKIIGTSYEGLVLSLNDTRGGIYSGNRYPINVRITKANNSAVGKVFEYSIEQLVVID